MARFPFESTLTDQYGRIIVSGTVTVNLTGTSTAATVYAAESGGSAITDSQITTGSDGTYKFWVDDGDFGLSQRFRLVLAGGSPFVTRTIDDVVVLPGITLDSSDTLTNKTIDADNNTISNLALGAEVNGAASADYSMSGNNFTNIGVLFLKEQAAADANVAGSGQIWVKTASPNTLQFSDDVGTDFVLVHRSDKLDVFAATTSAELAGVISDETGSGVLVLATTPTLVTPVLGDASGTSLTLTGSTETDTDTLTKGNIVRAWIKFQVDGTTDDSYNMDAVTDSGLGDFVVNFTTNFADANYCVVAGIEASDAAVTINEDIAVKNGSQAVGSVGIITVNSQDGTTDRDPARVHVLAIGAQ